MKQMDRIWQIRDLGMSFSEFMREMEMEVRTEHLLLCGLGLW